MSHLFTALSFVLLGASVYYAVHSNATGAIGFLGMAIGCYLQP